MAAVCAKRSNTRCSTCQCSGSRRCRRATSLMNALLRDGEQRLMLLALLRGSTGSCCLPNPSGSRVATDEAARVISAPPFVVRKRPASPAACPGHWRHTGCWWIWVLSKAASAPKKVRGTAVYQLLARRMGNMLERLYNLLAKAGLPVDQDTQKQLADYAAMLYNGTNAWTDQRVPPDEAGCATMPIRCCRWLKRPISKPAHR